MPGVQIFSDKKFFILQRVPSRSSFIDIIERNGGRVVKIEQQADYTIADHLRKDAPYGSLSYKFIEDAVRSGEIPTEDKYRNGTSTSGPSPRAVGGLSQPVKGTRTPFSAEDDQVLYQWVADYGSRGGSVRGNEIYKELERKNPRHTYQSWRDRYIKYLSNKPPPTLAPNGPPTPPSDFAPPTSADRAQVMPRTTGTPTQRPNVRPAQHRVPENPVSKYPHGFTEGDLELVMDDVEHIQNITPENIDEAWKTYAEHHGSQTAEQWSDFYTNVVKPEWERRNAEKEKARRWRRVVEDTLQTKQKPSYFGRAVSRCITFFTTTTSANKAASQKQITSEASEVTTAVTGTAPEMRKRPVPEETKVDIKRQRITVEDTFEKRTQPRGLQPLSKSAQIDSKAQPAPALGLSRPIALTKENLSQMQAQHRASRTSRGNDLAEDDEDEDQTGYANYLQGVLASLTSTPANPAKPKSAPRSVMEIPESIQGESDEEEEDEEEEEEGESQRGISEDLGSSPPLQRTRAVQLPDNDSELDAAEASRQLLEENNVYRRSQSRIHEAFEVRTSGLRNAFAPAPASRNAFATTSTSGFRYPRASANSQPPPLSSSDPPPIGSSDDEDEPTLTQLQLPELEGGSYGHLSSQSSDRPLPSVEQVPKMNAFETQNIFDAAEPEFDFTLPDIDQSVRDPSQEIRRQSRRRSDYLRDNSRSVTPIDSTGDADVDDYFKTKIDAGYKEKDIGDALHACSLQLGLTEIALEFLHQGRDLPKTTTGIWTPKEDEDLQSSDPAKLHRLERKHGPREVNRRLQYLNAINA
ncbi:putative TRF2-interacting telomeric protein [Elsinoe australis]|uniref:DNA-binding protein RAP1 n=1 Tax=Elsinoe australis TaxID=40998 RepID=A0A4U7B1V3_9PEZI|nr:putative TRF2-interacting telomeric protein [Elsinoe australis]